MGAYDGSVFQSSHPKDPDRMGSQSELEDSTWPILLGRRLWRTLPRIPALPKLCRVRGRVLHLVSVSP
jgi:hypothetical protein